MLTNACTSPFFIACTFPHTVTTHPIVGISQPKL